MEQRRRAQHASIAQLQRQKESLLRQQRAFEEAMAKIQSEAMQSKATAFRALQEVERQHQLLSVGADGDVVMEEEMGEETPTGFGFDASTGADNLSSFSMTAGATSSMSSRPSSSSMHTASRTRTSQQQQRGGGVGASSDEPLRLVKFKKPRQSSRGRGRGDGGDDDDNDVGGGSGYGGEQQCTYLGNCTCPKCQKANED